MCVRIRGFENILEQTKENKVKDMTVRKSSSSLQKMAARASEESLKLFIDPKARKVIFAEASKPFVDFLFSIMWLPLGAVAKLLKDSEVWSLEKLYNSIVNLSNTYIQTNRAIDSVLNPKVSLPSSSELPRHVFKVNKYNVCGGTHNLEDNCKDCLYAVMFGPGFVKDAVTYMVMDDLEVKPQSTVSIMNVLDEINIKSLGSLRIKDVKFGVDEALKLLKVALYSESVLTDVLLE